MTGPDGETQTSSEVSKAEGLETTNEEILNRDGHGPKIEALELDHGLILRAQRLTTGATVHRFSQALTIYIGNVALWNRFVSQGSVSSGELKEKTVLRDRALALEAQLRQEIVKEELRSIGARNDRFG